MLKQEHSFPLSVCARESAKSNADARIPIGAIEDIDDRNVDDRISHVAQSIYKQRRDTVSGESQPFIVSRGSIRRRVTQAIFKDRATC